jgi:hypothetical protein
LQAVGLLLLAFVGIGVREVHGCWVLVRCGLVAAPVTVESAAGPWDLSVDAPGTVTVLRPLPGTTIVRAGGYIVSVDGPSRCSAGEVLTAAQQRDRVTLTMTVTTRRLRPLCTALAYATWAVTCAHHWAIAPWSMAAPAYRSRGPRSNSPIHPAPPSLRLDPASVG